MTHFLRNLWQHKTYSFLNVFGLAIGVACAGLIFLWVEDEKGYDKAHAKKEVLYRILENQTYDGKTRTFWSTPGLLGPAIQTEIPGIANTCRARWDNKLFSIGEKAVYERGGFVDGSVFDMFSLEFTQGNAAVAFSQLYNVVLTEKMTARFFGKDNNVIGKQLLLDNKQAYTVAGVVKDLPENSTLDFDWLASFEVYAKDNDRLTQWGSNSIATYAELQPGTDPALVNKKLYAFIEQKEEGATARAFLFGMNDWRLRDHFEDGFQTGGRIAYIRMFTVIAWIILLIACINFMNLATARSEKRAREVGVRKVLGAGRGSLVLKFMGEAISLSLLAVTIGAGIIVLVLPAFNLLIEKQLTPGFDNPVHILSLLGIALLCGLVAGSYPSLYLSSFNPVTVFKGIRAKNSGPALVRKTLVVLQFSVSIILIISTIIIYQQIQHVKSRDLGYDKNNLLSIDVRGDMVKNFNNIRQELLNTGLIENAALNSFNTISIGNNSSNFSWQGKDPDKDILISSRLISPEFIATAGMKLQDGRNFYANAADSSSVLVTASLAKLMGTGSAIGKIIEYGETNYTIVGVVKDFLYGDMYGKSDPVVFLHEPGAARFLYVRSKAGVPMEQALAKIEATIKKAAPGFPFDYKFVDDQFDQQFKSETLISKLSRIFALLAIIISCLGLFGLATYTAERRTKEIGIRKVLGASAARITALLSRDFLLLVLLSALIAFPVAWWAMNNWLQAYAYRITISGWVFLAAGILAVIIAFATISFQAIKAAMANPVKTMRTE